MSDRLLICARCDCTIERNTPLEHGGTRLPVPDLCETCRVADERDTGPHALEVLSLGFYPAAVCKCGRWGFTTSNLIGDTVASKLALITAQHKKHVEETK